MKFRLESPSALILFVVAGCAPPAIDGESSETDDEVGTTDSTESDSDTSGDSTSETATDTDTETETETGDPPDPVCGNAIVEGPELCDDGNTVDDDGCSNACAPRLCEITWTRVDEDVTITGSIIGNAPPDELPNGNIVVGNTVDGETGIDIRVQVWTPDGDLVWEVVHELGALRDAVGDVLADESGDIFVAGAANIGTDGIARVLRLSGIDGSILWTFEQDVAGTRDQAIALTFDDQNRVLAALEVAGKSGETDVEVHALDPMTGESQWSAHWTSEGNLDEAPSGIAFDAATGRIWVTANPYMDGDPPVIFERLLAFEPPDDMAVIDAVPIDDGDADYDRYHSLVINEQGRMWMSWSDREVLPDDVLSHEVIVEIDPADGSGLGTIDSRDLAIEGDMHDSYGLGILGAFADGGLVLSGFTHANQDLGIEHYGYVVLLDAEGQHDCVAELMDYSGGNYPFQPFAASTGAVYVNGFVRESGDWHSLLVRIR